MGNDAMGLGSYTNMINRKAGRSQKIIRFVDKIKTAADRARENKAKAAAEAGEMPAEEATATAATTAASGEDGDGDGEEKKGEAGFFDRPGASGTEGTYDFGPPQVFWDDFDDDGREIPQLVLTGGERGVLFLVFMLAGIANSAPWTFYSTAIAYFVQKFPLGPTFIPIINAAYTACALPVLLVQSALDERADARWGSRATFTVRFLTINTLLAMTLFVLPFVPGTDGGQGIAILLAIILGSADSGGFTSASQIFSILPATAGSGFMMGASFSPVIALGLHFAFGFGDSPTDESAIKVFCTAGIFPLLGMCGMLYLIRGNRVGAALLLEKDAVAIENIQRKEREEAEAKMLKEAGEGDGATLMTAEALKALQKDAEAQAAAAAADDDDDDDDDLDALMKKKKQKKNDGDVEEDGGDTASDTVSTASSTTKKMSNKELFMATLGSQGALFLGFFLTSMISSTAAIVPSENDYPGFHDNSLGGRLVFSMMFGSLLARQATLIPCKIITNGSRVFVLQLLNTLSSVFYFVYMAQAPKVQAGEPTLIPLNDWVIVIYIGANQFIKAYCGSSSFAIASSVLTNAPDRAQAANILGLTLTAGMYIGIVIAFPLAPLADVGTLVNNTAAVNMSSTTTTVAAAAGLVLPLS